MKNIVYKYGLLAPLSGAEKISEQISLAHKYFNVLIAIERKRREEDHAAMAPLPAIAAINVRIATAEAALGVAKEALDKASLKKLDAELGSLNREYLRARTDAIKADPIKAAEVEVINERANVAAREGRSKCGCYSGTYQIIEAAVQQSKRTPDPHFRRWTGDGAVAVQISGGGIPVGKLYACTDTRVRIDNNLTPVPGRGGKPLPTLHLRVASDPESHGPVWAAFPLIQHRDLPQGMVKWVRVHRQHCGSHWRWSVHITVECEEAPAKQVAGGGVIAVDLHWNKISQFGEPTTRAAAWADDSGNLGYLAVIGEAELAPLYKESDLDSIRDKNFNAVKSQLSAQLKLIAVPEEHAERLAYLGLWQSQGRLAGAATWWRTHRFVGDDAAYALVEEWRKQDRHLWDWQANAQRKNLERRLHVYRNFAANAARVHSVLVVEKLNLSKLAADKKADDIIAKVKKDRANTQRHATAPSELRGALINAFRREGGTIVEVPSGSTPVQMVAAYHAGVGEEKAKPIGPSKVSRMFMTKAERESVTV